MKETTETKETRHAQDFLVDPNLGFIVIQKFGGFSAVSEFP